MIASSKFKADRAIYARREEEARLASLNTAIRSDANLRHTAEWQHKTENMVKSRVVRDRIYQKKEEREEQLEERRRKLAAKLQMEEEIYQKEFHENLETPEQVRQHMAKKLFLLKQQRQEERKQLVEQANEKRMRENTDELRLADSKFYTQQCALEREEQLRDKKRRRDQEIFEEMLFAKLWDIDMKKKIERENKEKREKEMLVKDTMDIISWQNKTRSGQEREQKMKEEQEKRMLNDLWNIEQEKEKEIERQKHLLNKERNLELIRHNQMEKEIRDMEEQKEKDRDKHLLQMALDREQALQDLEYQEKEERRKEAKELQEHYKQQSDDQQREEAMIEYLTRLEEEKQRKIQEDKWRKEDEARIQLLREVYESRAQNIENKKMFRNEDMNNVMREKDELDRALELQNRLHEEKVINQKLNKNKHQVDVLKQVGEKERGKKKSYQETMFEQRAMKLAELDYTRKISSENEKNQQLLTTLRSTQRPY
jgi:cilia- and flagella-associated protein 53